jgi:hypothetical protein
MTVLLRTFHRGPCLDRGRSPSHFTGKGGASWTRKTSNTSRFFETMSKRRKGFPSEAKVKKGVRVVHGDKELEEKVGRNDLCPCGSGRLFKKCCRNSGCF